jgi:transcriptional regulator with XRE-family HTH domain
MALADAVPGNLKQARLKKKLTQADLAERTGLSVAYISLLERGARCPPLPTLDLLADALGVRGTSLLEA